MLSGSAILRISALLVVAGCLAALVQFLLPRPATAPGPRATAPASAPPAAPPPRRIETAPQAAAPVVVPSTPTAVSPRPQPVPSADAPPAPRMADPSPTPAPVALPPPLQRPQTGEPAIDAANDAAGPRALVDLNTGALADLNRLRGGGSIGRTIVQHRPYAAIDQLLSKRVLSRATYDKIKDQVTVR